MIIAIDGTSGSGKSTTAKRLAEELGFFHIDSGSLYRIATYFCITNKIDSNDDNLEAMLENMNIELDNKKFLLNGKDVSLEIREHYISDSVSDYSSNIIIRNKLSSLQKKLARNKDVIIEGRDIGTTVFPNADYKFYLDVHLFLQACLNKYQYFNVKY